VGLVRTQESTGFLKRKAHLIVAAFIMPFWDTLEEIAAKEEMSLATFLTTLHNEVLDRHGEVNNFASLLRCSCLIYRSGSAAVGRPGPSWQRRGHSRRGRIG
jgi:predicted DNA-binding ribbon-helix-helix protein